MNLLKLDPSFDSSLRSALLEHGTAAPRRNRRRVIWSVAAVVVGLSSLGTAGAIAASQILPGQYITATIGTKISVDGQGSKAIQVETAPAETNALQFSLTCRGAGVLTFDDGSRATCDGQTVSDRVKWSSSLDTFRIMAPDTITWHLVYSFAHQTSTALGRNSRGQSFGVDSSNGHPDLIAATATNGEQGYISRVDEDRATCGNMKSRAAAVACNEAAAGKTQYIPVYAEDGTTKIGVFEIAG